MTEIKTSATSGYIPMTRQHRQGVIYDGVMLGYTIPRIAQYLGVSVSTIRRDLTRMPRTRELARRGTRRGTSEAGRSWELSPDAYRSRP